MFLLACPLGFCGSRAAERREGEMGILLNWKISQLTNLVDSSFIGMTCIFRVDKTSYAVAKMIYFFHVNPDDKWSIQSKCCFSNSSW